MGEGYKTINTVTELFAGHLSTVGGYGAAFDGSVKSGSVIDITDSELGADLFLTFLCYLITEKLYTAGADLSFVVAEHIEKSASRVIGLGVNSGGVKDLI